jgi:hypothetical protein
MTGEGRVFAHIKNGSDDGEALEIEPAPMAATHLIHVLKRLIDDWLSRKSSTAWRQHGIM